MKRILGVFRIICFLAFWAAAIPFVVAVTPGAAKENAVGQPRPSSVPRTPTETRSATSTSFPSAEMDAIVRRFEKEVSDIAGSLSKIRSRKAATTEKVESLKKESSALRQKLESGVNVLVEAQLKTVLVELRSQLEAQSKLESQWEEARREFEEKSLSLLSLYNDRIEQEIASPEAFLNPAASQKRLEALVNYARNRTRLLELLQQYRGVEPERPFTGREWSSGSLPVSKDRESLELTVHLLKDHRREVETRIEQSNIKEQETLKEISLQERMREFMDDVERLHENAAFPLPRSKRRDLEWFRGRDEVSRLKERLQLIRRQRDQDQIRLIQLDSYLDQVGYQLKTLKEQGGKRREK